MDQLFARCLIFGTGKCLHVKLCEKRIKQMNSAAIVVFSKSINSLWKPQQITWNLGAVQVSDDRWFCIWVYSFILSIGEKVVDN